MVEKTLAMEPLASAVSASDNPGTPCVFQVYLRKALFCRAPCTFLCGTASPLVSMWQRCLFHPARRGTRIRLNRNSGLGGWSTSVVVEMIAEIVCDSESHDGCNR
jgi:hypothetical protein